MVAILRPATIADLDAMPDDGNRYELLYGKIVMAAAPTLRHQLTVRVIADLLKPHEQSHPLGVVIQSPLDVILGVDSTLQPDIVYMARSAYRQTSNGRVAAIPLLVVEAISPTNANVDRVSKLFRYAEAGIPEYWIADPEQREIAILSLNGRIYVPRAPDADGRLHSVALPSLNVDPIALFAKVDELMPSRT